MRRVDLTLDEAYERMHRTGPEFDGWLSNHGPMAADAILRMGHGPELDRWLQDYAGRLDAAPARRWGIASSDWLEYLGDPSRLGDWTDFFSLRLREEPWREVLTPWWPRLLPGSIAASTHGLIRTGHAVRALLEQETEPRVDELGNALGYWAARWQPLPRAIGSAEAGRGATRGPAAWTDLLRSTPTLDLTGGARARLHQLDTSDAWAVFLQRNQPPEPVADEVPAAIDDLVDAAVSAYADWASGHPVMLVHAATAPRAAGLVLPALPRRLWQQTLRWSWQTSAAIAALYRPSPPATGSDGHVGLADGTEEPDLAEWADLADLAVRHADEHVIKLTEVALESMVRGRPRAAAAVQAALAEVPPA